MKTVPTQITPIFLWQRAEHLDTERNDVGKIDFFEYERETYCLFESYDIVCYKDDYEKVRDELISESSSTIHESDYSFTPYIRAN